MLVLGGAGGVGAGIVAALLARGGFAKVVVAVRDVAKRDAVLARNDAADASRRLATVVGNVDDLATAAALRAEAEAHGPLQAVVASLGGWWEGPALTELDERAWDEQMRALLRPHFIAARTFVPALEDRDTRYLVVGGGAALTPVPHSALVSIAGAAQVMFVRALVAERRHRVFPIVEELIIDGPVKTHARHHGPVTEGEITAREIGEVVAGMLHDGTTGAWPNVVRDGPLVTIRAKPH